MQSFFYTPISLASILLLFSAQANAQKTDEEELSAVYGDKTIVSIATGNSQPLRRAPSVATVITQEDISTMGAHDLEEALESVPGMHISRESLFYGTKVLIRGIGTGNPTNPQVLFLLNGIPITTSYAQDRGVSFQPTIPLRNVARIEIIRGPGSALYGADAYAGVVNVITKTSAETPGTEFGLHIGSQKTRSGWIQYGGKIGSVDVAAFVSAEDSDGINEFITADAATRNDSIFKTKSSLAPGRVNNQRKMLDININLSYENFRLTYSGKSRENGTGAGTAAALDTTGYSRGIQNLLALSWVNRNFGEDLTIGTSFSLSHSSDETPDGIVLLPPGTKLPTGLFPDGVIGGPNRWERQIRLSAYANYTGFKDHQIRIGLGHDDLNLYKATTYKNFISNAQGTPVPNGPVMNLTDIQPHILPTRRKVNYFYIQNEWEISRNIALTAGVRYDRYSDFGNTTNPRLALVWDASQNVTTKLLFGRAFRAPSFNETYSINVVANGNRKLAPETISTTELATTWTPYSNLQMNFNVFVFTRKNIIGTRPNAAPAPGSTYQNTGSQSGKGLEFEINWEYSRSLRMSGNYSHQKTIDDVLNKDVGYAPRHHLYGRVDWKFANGWALSSQVNWVADRARPAGDTRQPISDYKTLDLTLRTTRGINQWDFTASVRNLFNAEVKEPSLAPGLTLPNDLPLSRRTFYFQAIYKL